MAPRRPIDVGEPCTAFSQGGHHKSSVHMLGTAFARLAGTLAICAASPATDFWCLSVARHSPLELSRMC
eukprot:scaffold75663_cov31-Tisochrysis_lutea.AAC.6